MAVRLAVDADVDRIVSYVFDLVDAINGPVAVDAEVTRESVLLLMANPNSVVFVSKAGFIAGTIAPTLISPELIAQEVGWFATDRSGPRLLRAFESWADAKGVRAKISTKHTDLTRQGYVQAETSWIK